MSQRAKGQEVSINIVRGGVLENTFTAILNFNSEDVFEIIKKGYLGEKGDRHDFIFSESKGDFEMHLQTQDWFRFRIAVKQKATREQPDLQFNISKTLFFPNGESPTVNFNDVSFGPMPENVPARNDYVKVKVDFACDGDDIALS
jgi:hypothetical protein